VQTSRATANSKILSHSAHISSSPSTLARRRIARALRKHMRGVSDDRSSCKAWASDMIPPRLAPFHHYVLHPCNPSRTLPHRATALARPPRPPCPAPPVAVRRRAATPSPRSAACTPHIRPTSPLPIRSVLPAIARSSARLLCYVSCHCKKVFVGSSCGHPKAFALLGEHGLCCVESIVGPGRASGRVGHRRLLAAVSPCAHQPQRVRVCGSVWQPQHGAGRASAARRRARVWPC